MMTVENQETAQANPKLKQELGIRYGIMLSIVGIILNVAGQNFPGMGIKFGIIALGVFSSILFFVLGIKAFKKQNQGLIKFGDAFAIVAIITVVSSIISGLFGYLYGTVIDPGSIDRQIQETVSFLENIGAPEAQIDKAIEELNSKLKDPAGYLASTLQGVMGGIIGYLIIGAIVAAIMKKEEKEV
ncbi:DUF4199 domain-containing protein [Persicobacter diffluens]|uniref:DUF4199 domain-containing protein n=1 Tax=Persicobacter diffluens TaxID=981 RepID=A0AAN5AJK6_9BACT|nr:hypothetical protein PEDI_23020 [Persicobacter diffluens]